MVGKIPNSVDKEVGRKIRYEILQSTSINDEKTELIRDFYKELNFNSKAKIYVVRQKDFNAFALPDNSIFIYERVLKEVESYPELAALLAHEYAHIENRHGMKTLAHALSREFITTILTGEDRSETLIYNSNKLLTLENSRHFEFEADKEGLSLLAESKINLNGMVDLFNRMNNIKEKSYTHSPVYLSTHPHTEDRLEVIEEEIKQQQNDYLENPKLEKLFQKLIQKEKYVLY